MERELQNLRQRLSQYEPLEADPTGTQLAGQQANGTQDANDFFDAEAIQALHQGAADSLLELRNSTDIPLISEAPQTQERTMRLENAVLTMTQIEDLFREYFSHYHPFLPFLDPEKSPDHYYGLSELLFWTIVAVGARRYEEDPTLLTGLASPLSNLLWSTIASLSTLNYHCAKALCLICTWPLPTKSTSTDPTYLLSGIMTHLAMQNGLHRPAHAQDFCRMRVVLNEQDQSDRLKTWAACNIVAQT